MPTTNCFYCIVFYFLNIACSLECSIIPLFCKVVESSSINTNSVEINFLAFRNTLKYIFLALGNLVTFVKVLNIAEKG